MSQLISYLISDIIRFTTLFLPSLNMRMSNVPITKNTGPSRGEWRDRFTQAPFDAFTKAFPDGSFPTIFRKTGQYRDSDTGDENPEIYHFVYSKIAFFGLNRVPRPSYVSSNADLDYNVVWVKEMLKLDTNCDLQTVGKSIDYNMVFSSRLVLPLLITHLSYEYTQPDTVSHSLIRPNIPQESGIY